MTAFRKLGRNSHYSARLTAITVAIGLGMTLGGCFGGAKSDPGAKAAAGKSQKASKPSLWQRLINKNPEPFAKYEPDSVRQGKGLLTKDKDGYVLYRHGESGSGDPDKPRKARR